MKHTHTRSRALRRLIALLSVILLMLCIAATVGSDLLATRPKEGTVEYTVWQYARENGYSLKDYPASLIELLKRNPETEQFVLQYPAAKDAVQTIDMSDYLDCETVPLFLQWDPRWGYLTYGSDVAGLTGCGPVCLSMAAIYVTADPSFSPDAMLRFAAEQGYYVRGSGSSWTLISEGGPKLGLTVTELPLDKGRIQKALSAGCPVICAMGPGDFTTSGHFVVISGVRDGLFQINDPNSRSNSEKLWSYEQLQGQIRNLWSVGFDK